MKKLLITMLLMTLLVSCGSSQSSEEVIHERLTTVMTEHGLTAPSLDDGEWRLNEEEIGDEIKFTLEHRGSQDYDYISYVTYEKDGEYRDVVLRVNDETIFE